MQYRVSLWIESLGDMLVPDVCFQLQADVVLTPYSLFVSAMLMAGKAWVCEGVVELLVNGRWSVVYARSSVSLCGTECLCLR